jgi:hypothetical protein
MAITETGASNHQDLTRSKLKCIESIHEVYFDATSHAPTENELRLCEPVPRIRENTRACSEDDHAVPD